VVLFLMPDRLPEQPAREHAAIGPPSPWLLRWAHLIAQGGTVLDVACGSGRHVRWLAERGWRVTGVDRDAAALAPLAACAETIVADLENGPWPLEGRRFDAVLVTNYLWRALLPKIVASVAEGGVLIYETFAVGNESVGKPSRADFLLRPGELLEAASGLRVVAYEAGFLDSPARYIQRIVAVREPKGLSPAQCRHALEAGGAR
jgi:SAM-dependent methyltransferase